MERINENLSSFHLHKGTNSHTQPTTSFKRSGVSQSVNSKYSKKLSTRNGSITQMNYSCEIEQMLSKAIYSNDMTTFTNKNCLFFMEMLNNLIEFSY